jgi:hypothetical protein
MTEEPRCYENARAERLNGILKQEYSLGCSFRSRKQALATVGEAVSRYGQYWGTDSASTGVLIGEVLGS